MTSVDLPGRFGAGYADYGRKTVAEMVALIRDHAELAKRDAEAILAAKDTDFHVETYCGIHVRRSREILQAGKSR